VLANAGFRETRKGEIGERAASFHCLDAVPAKGLPLYVAAVAMIDDYGRVLLAKRPAGKAMAGLWEFPGGKIERGERPRAALARELSEELAVEASLGDLWPYAIASHAYAEVQLLMPLLLCRRWSGTPEPREGQSIAWATAKALARFPMPAADAPLVEELSPLLAP
jgi:8-oxo-dGTP diphosphatase